MKSIRKDNESLENVPPSSPQPSIASHSSPQPSPGSSRRWVLDTMDIVHQKEEEEEEGSTKTPSAKYFFHEEHGRRVKIYESESLPKDLLKELWLFKQSLFTKMEIITRDIEALQNQIDPSVLKEDISEDEVEKVEKEISVESEENVFLEEDHVEMDDPCIYQTQLAPKELHIVESEDYSISSSDEMDSFDSASSEPESLMRQRKMLDDSTDDSTDVEAKRQRLLESLKMARKDPQILFDSASASQRCHIM